MAGLMAELLSGKQAVKHVDWLIVRLSGLDGWLARWLVGLLAGYKFRRGYVPYLEFR